MDGMRSQNLTEQSRKSTNGQQKNSWTIEEKKAIAAVAFPLIEEQKAYGREINAKLILQGWEKRFAGEYPIEQVIYALNCYADSHEDFPTRANILAILQPEEPKISDAEFVAAQKWQDRNQNYSPYTPEAQVIATYKKQKSEKREDYNIQCESLRKIAQSSVRRMVELTEKEKKQLEEQNRNR